MDNSKTHYEDRILELEKNFFQCKYLQDKEYLADIFDDDYFEMGKSRKRYNKQNARRALTLTTILTLFVAGFELFFAFMLYKPGMNFLDVTSFVTSNKYLYFLLLIVANMALLPSAVLLYKENGISLKNEIFEYVKSRHILELNLNL